MSNGFEAGVQVRLISDPGREGILSGQTRDRRGVKMHFVHFPDSPTWLREEALELYIVGVCESCLLAKVRFRLPEY